MKILIINAGLAGDAGNSQIVAEHCAAWLSRAKLGHRTLVLRDSSVETASGAIAEATHLIFVSGTYWGGCSSLLQALLEHMTVTEAGPHWLGKPAAVFVTAHQVGAQEVLFRLQGTLVTLGCLLPPLSGVVILRVSELLRQRAPETCEDVWSLADVDTSLANLVRCGAPTQPFQSWSVDREDFTRRWLVPS